MPAPSSSSSPTKQQRGGASSVASGSPSDAVDAVSPTFSFPASPSSSGVSSAFSPHSQTPQASALGLNGHPGIADVSPPEGSASIRALPLLHSSSSASLLSAAQVTSHLGSPSIRPQFTSPPLSAATPPTAAAGGNLTVSANTLYYTATNCVLPLSAPSSACTSPKHRHSRNSSDAGAAGFDTATASHRTDETTPDARPNWPRAATASTRPVTNAKANPTKTALGNSTRSSTLPDVDVPTPHADRIHRLSQRLSGIHVGLENERQARSSLHRKVGSLEHNIDSIKTDQDTVFADLRKQIQDLCESLEKETLERKKYQAAKNKQLDELAQRMSEAAERQQAKVEDCQAKCWTEFEDKTRALREELLKEHMNLVDTQTLIQQYCNVEIPKLSESLREESQQRVEMEERILKEASAHISRVTDLIQREQRERESQAQSMLHLIEQVVSKTQAQLLKERGEREATEATLFQLLEDTICKLDAATQLQ